LRRCIGFVTQSGHNSAHVRAPVRLPRPSPRRLWLLQSAADRNIRVHALLYVENMNSPSTAADRGSKKYRWGSATGSHRVIYIRTNSNARPPNFFLFLFRNGASGGGGAIHVKGLRFMRRCRESSRCETLGCTPVNPLTQSRAQTISQSCKTNTGFHISPLF
jgi:predicted outer membrane repeat protein